jgi:hypothetical protein
MVVGPRNQRYWHSRSTGMGVRFDHGILQATPLALRGLAGRERPLSRAVPRTQRGVITMPEKPVRNGSP